MTDTLSRQQLAERWETTPPTISRMAAAERIPQPMPSPKRRGRVWSLDEIEAFESSGFQVIADSPDELIDGIADDLRMVASDDSVPAELRGAAEAVADFLEHSGVDSMLKAALLPGIAATDWHAEHLDEVRKLRLLRARTRIKSLIRKANKR